MGSRWAPALHVASGPQNHPEGAAGAERSRRSRDGQIRLQRAGAASTGLVAFSVFVETE